MQVYAMIQKSIKDNDGKLAIRVLQLRNDYEYEGFEIVEVKEKYGD